MVGGVLRHTDEGDKREQDVGVPTHQFRDYMTIEGLTGIAGNPLPVYFFMIAPSGPFEVP
jgi:hypothetical protein